MSTEIENFVGDAIRSGYTYNNARGGKFVLDKNGHWWWSWLTEDEDGSPIRLELPTCFDHIDRFKSLLLDSNAWKMVGKARGWYMGEYTQKAQDFIYKVFAEEKDFNTALSEL